MSNMCPVCGYAGLEKPAYVGDPKTTSGSFEICPSCGYQFGYTDQDRHISFERWRQQWIAGGMIWDKGLSKPPLNWNPRQQLLNVGVQI